MMIRSSLSLGRSSALTMPRPSSISCGLNCSISINRTQQSDQDLEIYSRSALYVLYKSRTKREALTLLFRTCDVCGQDLAEPFARKKTDRDGYRDKSWQSCDTRKDGELGLVSLAKRCVWSGRHETVFRGLCFAPKLNHNQAFDLKSHLVLAPSALTS